MVLVSHIHSFTCNRILWQVALWSVGHIEIKFDIDKIDLLWCSMVLQGFPKLSLLKVHYLVSNVISNLVAPFLLPHTWTSIMDIWWKIFDEERGHQWTTFFETCVCYPWKFGLSFLLDMVLLWVSCKSSIEVLSSRRRQ